MSETHRFYQQQTATYEQSFIVETTEPLNEGEIKKLGWLMSDPAFFGEGFGLEPFIQNNGKTIIEIGTRPNFVTDDSTKKVSICNAIGIKKVTRIEVFRRYDVKSNDEAFVAANHDRTTEMWYKKPFTKLSSDKTPSPVRVINVLNEGMEALERMNKELRLKIEPHHLEHILAFCKRRNLNITDSGLFYYAQGNSEHCRHFAMKGIRNIDGKLLPYSLIDIVQEPNKLHRSGSIIAFNDDASAQRGGDAKFMIPAQPGQPCEYIFEIRTVHPTCKVETHNAPCLVDAFQGAMTGIGGIWRDIFVIGIGGKASSGGTGICTGSYYMPWFPISGENPIPGYVHPQGNETALQIRVRGSNGGSRYMNESGVPLTHGFLRTFEQQMPWGEHLGFIKPVFLVSADGYIDDRHTQKKEVKPGMLVCMIGGEAFPTGMGGASMSSGGQKSEEASIDFDAVQRGNAEMKRKVMEAMITFVNLGDKNPLIKPGDQGGGGIANHLAELLNPYGGRIQIRNVRVGDKTMAVIQIFCAEFQERIGFIIYKNSLGLVQDVCNRERVPLEVLGEITGDGRYVVNDAETGMDIVDFELEDIFGNVPRKTYTDTRIIHQFKPLELPQIQTTQRAHIEDLVWRVLQQPSVGSKRDITDKSDRSVTGCVRLQPGVGPLDTPVADAGITAYSLFDKLGSVRAFGEQPIAMLVDYRAISMAVAEMCLNMCCAYIGSIDKIKTNWNEMMSHDSPGEAANITYILTHGMDMIKQMLGCEPDGGKDSMGMKFNNIKSPTEVTVKGYAHMDDCTRFVTPDFKKPGTSSVIVVDGAPGKYRLGGSALAQALGQVGDEAPLIDDVPTFMAMWNALQELVGNNDILAYHDCAGDGGIITTLIEMAISGNTGVTIEVPEGAPLIGFLFSQEARTIIECDSSLVNKVFQTLEKFGVRAYAVGTTSKERNITVMHNAEVVFQQTTATTRSHWESVADAIAHDPDQMNTDLAPALVAHHAADIPGFPYHLSFIPKSRSTLVNTKAIKVVVLREEGTNGHVEMATAHKYLGMRVTEMHMSDLLFGKVKNLDAFDYWINAGGFPFGDAFGSGKGQAGIFRFNEHMGKILNDCIARNMLMTGTCAGFQFMTSAGLFTPGVPEKYWPQLVRNTSRKFESQYPFIRVGKTNAVIMQGIEGLIAPGIVCHGDGRLIIPASEFSAEIEERVSLQFVDYHGNPTEIYPLNPNGSRNGNTSLTSPDGLRTGMMPHLIDRMYLKEQWPYMPEEWRIYAESPWLMLGINAREHFSGNR